MGKKVNLFLFFDSEGMFTFEMDIILRCIFFFSFSFSSTSAFTCRLRHVCFTGTLLLHPPPAVFVVGRSCFPSPRFVLMLFFFLSIIL